jgi:hypothetical protein
MPSLTHVKPVRAGTIFSFMVGEKGMGVAGAAQVQKSLQKTQG